MSWRILRWDGKLKAYQIQLVHELKPLNVNKRYGFVLIELAKFQENSAFSKQIWFRNETHFWVNAYAKKQNCRSWDEEEDEVRSKRKKKNKRFCVHGIIDPYVLKNNASKNETINGDRNRAIITGSLWPEIELADIWCQQDGSTSHTTNKSIFLAVKIVWYYIVIACEDM